MITIKINPATNLHDYQTYMQLREFDFPNKAEFHKRMAVIYFTHARDNREVFWKMVHNLVSEILAVLPYEYEIIGEIKEPETKQPKYNVNEAEYNTDLTLFEILKQIGYADASAKSLCTKNKTDLQTKDIHVITALLTQIAGSTSKYKSKAKEWLENVNKN